MAGAIHPEAEAGEPRRDHRATEAETRDREQARQTNEVETMTTDDDMREIEAALDEFLRAAWESKHCARYPKKTAKALLALIRQKLTALPLDPVAACSLPRR